MNNLEIIPLEKEYISSKIIYGDCDGPICIYCWNECLIYTNDSDEMIKKMDIFNSSYCRECKIYFKVLKNIPLFLCIEYNNTKIFNPIIDIKTNIIYDILNLGLKYSWKTLD